MNESPEIKCACGRLMRKVVSRCNVIVHNTRKNLSQRDSVRRETDLKTELREDYGIHNITPFHGATTADVLRDVKGSGTYVKDQMACEKQKHEERRNAKLKEWKPKAQKRASKRRAEMKEHKDAEAAQKRKINLMA
jgi:predicted nucleic acid-binding Zn ribbon protein